MKNLKNINLNSINIDFNVLLDRNILLFAATILFWILASNLDSYEQKIKEIKALKKEQDAANELFIATQILSEKLNNVYNVFESNLYTGKDDDFKNKEANVKFLNKIYALAEEYNVEILAFEPGGKKKKGKLTYIPYDLQINCDYEELGKFITALEGNNRIIIIDNITIKNGTEKIKVSNKNNIDAINNLNVILGLSSITINK